MVLRIIDVASHQAGILPSTVDCDGAIVKATGGNNYVNSACDAVMQDLISHNMPAGVYHFAHEYGSINSATEEADYFINNIQGYLGKAILALDYEIALNGQNYTQDDVQWCVEFIQRVIDKTGIVPLLYCSKGVLTQTNWQHVAELNVGGWIAQYATDQPMGWDLDPWTDNKSFGAITPVIYQYSSNGRINGWNASLDLNIFYGDREAWDKFAHANDHQDQNTGSEMKDYLSAFADDVIAGKYGTGEERKNSVYNAVQNAVNQKLG